MKLSTKGRYSVTALYELAQHYGQGIVPLKTIAMSQGLSENYLEQLMGTMRKAGLVTSPRGAQGGYELARAPEELTLCDLITAAGGRLPARRGEGRALRPRGRVRGARHLGEGLRRHQ